jgi:ribose-phosphate pyrophosphokinase
MADTSLDGFGGTPRPRRLRRLRTLLVTDSIETQPVALTSKIEVVSVAPLFGEAIRRIHQRESISVLFPK